MFLLNIKFTELIIYHFDKKVNGYTENILTKFNLD